MILVDVLPSGSGFVFFLDPAGRKVPDPLDPDPVPLDPDLFGLMDPDPERAKQ